MSIRRPGSPTCCAALPIIPPGGCTSCCPGTGTRRRSGTPSPRKIPRCRSCRLHAVSPRPRPDAYEYTTKLATEDSSTLVVSIEVSNIKAIHQACNLASAQTAIQAKVEQPSVPGGQQQPGGTAGTPEVGRLGGAAPPPPPTV